MLSAQTAFIGIDLTRGSRPFTCAALDNDLNLLALMDGGLDDALAFAGDFSSATVAVNASSRFSRDADGRAAERDLRGRGILVSKTPTHENRCAPRTRLGFSLYKRLEKKGFRPLPNARATHLWLETNSHACFCALVGQVPLRRRALEGRLQRQILLDDLGLGIKDPMVFFEEITRHRLLMGQLPDETLYTPSQLDALVAAHAAWMVSHRPGETTRVGGKEEGFIVLPVGELKEKY